MELSHLYSKPELCGLVHSFQEENEKLKGQLAKREKTHIYIETCHQRCLETLYKEIYELKQEIKILKEEDEEEDIEALRGDEMF